VTAVRLGYFEDFKANDTLLLDGDPAGLRKLVGQFRALAAGAVDSIAIHSLPFVETHHGLPACRFEAHHTGLLTSRSTMDHGGRIGYWRRSGRTCVGDSDRQLRTKDKVARRLEE
jgi:hypothetical protein